MTKWAEQLHVVWLWAVMPRNITRLPVIQSIRTRVYDGLIFKKLTFSYFNKDKSLNLVVTSTDLTSSLYTYI